MRTLVLIFLSSSLSLAVLISSAAAANQDAKPTEQEYLQKASEAKEAFKVKERTRALAIYKQLLRDNPRDAGAYICLGSLYQAMGEKRLAAETYSTGTRMVPDNVQLRLEELGYLNSVEQYAKLDKRLLEVAQLIRPEMPVDHLEMYRSLCHSRGFHKLEDNSIPHDTDAEIFKLVRFNCLSERTQKLTLNSAIASCLRVAKQNHDPKFNNALIYGYANISRYIWTYQMDVHEMIPIGRAAVKLNSNTIWTRLFLGLALVSENQTKEGNAELAMVTKLIPNFEPAGFLCVRLNFLLGKKETRAAIALIRNGSEYLRGPHLFGLVPSLLANGEPQQAAAILRQCTGSDDPSINRHVINLLVEWSRKGLKPDSLLDLSDAGVTRLNGLTEGLNKQSILSALGPANSFALIAKLAGRLEKVDPFACKEKGTGHSVYKSLESTFLKVLSTSVESKPLTFTKLRERFIDPLEKTCQNYKCPPFMFEGLAILLGRCNDLEAAEERMNRCVELYPTSVSARKLRASIELRLGKEKIAQADLDVLEKSGEHCTIEDLRKIRQSFESFLVAEVLVKRMKSTRYSDSVEYLKREQAYYLKRAATTSDAGALIHAAAIAITQLQYEAALKLLKQAESRGENSSRLYEVKSWALTALGKQDEAREARRAAVQCDVGAK